MLYTPEWIKQKYDECNEKYFNNKLPVIQMNEIEIMTCKNPWGRGGCKRFEKNPSTGEYEARGVVLKLSNYYDTPENEKLEILVHEMCHIYEYFCEPKYYIRARFINRRWDSNHPKHGHGLVFYEQARRLSQYGFHVERYISKDTQDIATVSDVTINKRKTSINQGFHCFKCKFVSPTQATDGKFYKFGYVFPAQTQYLNWLSYFERNSQDYIEVVDLFTHDPNILKSKTIKVVGRYYLTDNYENIYKGVDFENQNIIISDGKVQKKGGIDLSQVATIYDVNNDVELITKSIMDKVIKLGVKWDDDSYRSKFNKKTFRIKLANNRILTIDIAEDSSGYDDFRNGKLTLRIYNLGELIDNYEYYRDDYNARKTQDSKENLEYAQHELYYYIEKGITYVLDMCMPQQQLTVKRNQQVQPPQPQEQPQQQPVPEKPQLIQNFKMNTMKNGVPGTFELHNITPDELRVKLQERFPNWTAEKIESVMNNPKYLSESKIRLTEEDITEIVRQSLKNLEDKKLQMQMANLPDVLPGQIDVN